MMTQLRWRNISIALLALSTSLTHAPGANAETVWRMSNWVPPSHLLTREVLEP